jgi:PAT family beta-lactamase induction signal transducer AmpG
LLYVGLDAVSQSGAVPLAMVTGVITVEHFGEGLGTAVFMVYLMRCCDPAHKAAHMAILTALMSVSFTFAGVASGFMAEAWGFGTYFLFCFAATIPGMALIPMLPFLDGRSVSSATG